MTTTSSWLPLAEYSIKHHVSISTLRRRIKAEDITFRLNEGKYFILDEVPQKLQKTETHRPSLSREASPSVMPASKIQEPQKAEVEIQGLAAQTTTDLAGESVLSAANKLLVDLKKAYAQILQEKEEQIMFLKEETVDLKTLIKILEAENSRLRDALEKN